MAQLNVLNMNGEVVSTLSLNDSVFNQEWNDQIVYDVVKAQTAAMRQGSSQTLNRGDVRGGGKKPYRQKGTGHARQGTIRAPQYRGGGHVFELHPRDYSFKINRKVRRQALRIALSEKVKNGKLILVDSIGVTEPKTKTIATFLKAVKSEGRTLIVVKTPEKDQEIFNLELSIWNIPEADIALDTRTSVYDVLSNETLILSVDAAKYFEEALQNE